MSWPINTNTQTMKPSICPEWRCWRFAVGESGKGAKELLESCGMGEAVRESSLDDRLIDTLSDSAHAIGFRLLLPLLLSPFTIIYITRSSQSVSDALIVAEMVLIGGPRV
ncbi:unnamed protein product [Camellia sinensis]